MSRYGFTAAAVVVLHVLVLAAVMSLGTCAHAMPVTLTWTNPGFHAAVDDSGTSYCGADGDTLRTLWKVELWGMSSRIGGGNTPILLREKIEVGAEGLSDTLIVDVYQSWNVWMYPVNSAGIRAPCPSAVVTIGPSATGVDPVPAATGPYTIRWFNVRGGLVRNILRAPSGVYYFRRTYQTGAVQTGKTVILR